MLGSKNFPNPSKIEEKSVQNRNRKSNEKSGLGNLQKKSARVESEPIFYPSPPRTPPLDITYNDTQRPARPSASRHPPPSNKSEPGAPLPQTPSPIKIAFATKYNVQRVPALPVTRAPPSLKLPPYLAITRGSSTHVTSSAYRRFPSSAHVLFRPESGRNPVPKEKEAKRKV